MGRQADTWVGRSSWNLIYACSIPSLIICLMSLILTWPCYKIDLLDFSYFSTPRHSSSFHLNDMLKYIIINIHSFLTINGDQIQQFVDNNNNEVKRAGMPSFCILLPCRYHIEEKLFGALGP